METVLSNSKSRQLYSWWWDSHISPRNSKWLQENLTDMDKKVKSMIKLIEEDADSLSMRAEMFYRKRPELMKLVEEFYRAYRALAERYDHATCELRQAHKTMEKAFHTDQLGFSHIDNENQILLFEESNGLNETGKQFSLFTHKQCLEKIADLEKRLSLALEESRNLNEKTLSNKPLRIEDDIQRINHMNQNLEAVNQSLRLEIDNLTKNIMIKDEEIAKKHDDLIRTESNLKTLQTSHSQSLDDQKAMAVELKNLLQISKDFEYGKPEKELDIIETIPSAIRYLHNENSRLNNTCDLITGEKQALLVKNELLNNEKSNLVLQLENLEKRFTQLEKNHSCLNKDKESMLDRIEELKISTEPQLAILESSINILREENRWTKKDFEEEAVRTQLEIMNLQKFVQDMEKKNHTLSKLKSDLEFGILEQQVEVEILSDEIARMRLEFYKVFAALGIEFNELEFPHVLERIEDLKFFLKNYEDDYHHLLHENSVLRYDQVERDELLNGIRVKNIELSRTIQKLQTNHDNESKMIIENLEDQILELLEASCRQKMVIKSWELDASAIYFDLQVTSILQVVYQSKVHELIEACQALANESGLKTLEIERIKERAGSMDGEIGDLRSQLSVLEKNHMGLLEHIVFFPLDPSTVSSLHAKDYRDNDEPISQDHESIISKRIITETETTSVEAIDMDSTINFKDNVEADDRRVDNTEQTRQHLMERLSTDSKKLSNLKLKTISLLIKLAINERTKKDKRKMKKMKGFDIDAMKEQLTEIEEAVVQSECLNSKLKRNIQEIFSGLNENESMETFQMKRVFELAYKGSEKIAELELEFAKIQYVLMKLEVDDNKSDEKRGNLRRKKPFLSGCFVPDSTPIES